MTSEIKLRGHFSLQTYRQLQDLIIKNLKMFVTFLLFHNYYIDEKFFRRFVMEKFIAKIKKYYKIISPSLSILISSIGLVLSFLGYKYDGNSNKVLFFVLCISEIFLVASTVYAVVSVFKNEIDKLSLEAKNKEIEINKDTLKIILENNKSMLTTYKDFNDRLTSIRNNYINSCVKLGKLNDGSTGNNTYITNEKEECHKRLKEALIDSYKRFLSSTTNLLKLNIEKYLLTKGYNEAVSIAIKQLSTPTDYTEINKSNVDVFTAFRDSKTYNIKKRNETWKKNFKITKNSDFIMSIEKDYYIFNFMNRSFLENGLYLNENEAFYEDYNSGVTCTIYSCVNGKRILYGYIACDSLFKAKNDISDENIYDWNVANMMNTAHIIAMYLEHFYKIWNDLYVNYEENLDSWLQIDFSALIDNNLKTDNYKENIEKYGFCETMQDIVNSTRYNR